MIQRRMWEEAESRESSGTKRHRTQTCVIASFILMKRRGNPERSLKALKHSPRTASQSLAVTDYVSSRPCHSRVTGLAETD